MTHADHLRKLENMYHQAPINAFFRPQLHVQEGEATLVMEVRPEFFHAAKALHAAVYFKALDDVTFFPVQSPVTDAFVLTVSSTIYFLRPVTGGELRAVGQVVHRSRRLIVAEGAIHDSDGRVVGRGSGLFVPSQVPLSPEIGYN